jgi:hypothetical protein
MRADRSAAPVPPTEGTDAADADRGRFVFGADPARDRWWGRPLAETRWCLELARLLADPVWHGASVPHVASVLALPELSMTTIRCQS